MRRPVPTCPAPRGRETIPVRIALFLLAAASVPGFADDECAAVLREAERSYRAGRLEEALQVREACLERKATNAERARAHALLAKVHLARDEIDQAAAAITAALGLDPEFRPSLADPWWFVRLVEEEKARRYTVRNVSTVSKVDEALREAPATVVLVTAEEIERRGYLDLEELLHDLPGFDLSRGNGDVYSNVYMRGYRSDRSDRMLLLIDGVEHNDLHSNTVYLSRQYPLSNVEQVEVVYGPASTIYGANAFTGVISITTRNPEALLPGERRWAARVDLAGGSFATRSFDATVAGRSATGRVAFSLTARSFRSDEPELSGHGEWNYDPAELEALDYAALMRIDGPLALLLADDMDFWCYYTEYCEVVREGDEATIELTEAGAAAARAYDRALFAQHAGERSFRFSDATDDWAVDARLRVSNLVFGVQRWRREEGTTPWYTDWLRAGRDDGNVWAPEQTAIYARYSQPLGAGVVMNLFSRFKQHELADSGMGRFMTYAGRALDLVELAVFDTPSSFQQVSFAQRSNEFRNELTLVYDPGDRFALVGGLELRRSSVQVEFETEVGEQLPPGFAFFEIQLSDAKTDRTNLGVFVQGSYQLPRDFKIVLGGRLDRSRVRGEEVFVALDRNPHLELPGDTYATSLPLADTGTVFNPRLALVHTRGPLVFKAVYAEAFMEPSNFQKFTREPGVREIRNPELGSEEVRNFELGISYQRGPGSFLDVSLYEADYSDAVALKTSLDTNLASDSGRFMNTGRLRIRGLMVNASWRVRGWDFFGNYTWTDAWNVEPTDVLGEPLPEGGRFRIGDLARHRLNLGVDKALSDRWRLNLRTNYVGDRRTGAGTTVPDNPYSAIDAYFVAHATVGYEGLWPGARWQLVVRNLFDAEYYHPGVQRGGRGFAARLPQPGRAVFLRLSYRR